MKASRVHCQGLVLVASYRIISLTECDESLRVHCHGWVLVASYRIISLTECDESLQGTLSSLGTSCVLQDNISH